MVVGFGVADNELQHARLQTVVYVAYYCATNLV